MLFNSLVFVVFLILVLGIYYAVPSRAAKYVLVASSYFFYGWWDWRFLGLLLFSTVLDYTAGMALARTEKPRLRNLVLAISMTSNLGLLGFFKYFNFFAESVADGLRAIGMTPDFVTLSIVLPVGISFYTFQTMSYVIDVWRGNLRAERNLAVFAAFVSFFPQLVAGPIERAGNLIDQLRYKTFASREQIKSGLWIILWGYFLKVFMADNLGPVVDQIYAQIGSVSGIDILIAHYAFAFQIFGDFAGYSYIAIGVARLFGVNLCENFRFPYFVTSPSAFWRHWHISLSSWLRDYLYIPLGGNRGSKLFTNRNLMLTMLLGGLWHGAAWNFVAWGCYQGIILVLFRIADDYRSTPPPAKDGGVMSLTKIVAMFHITCVGWMLFRTPDMATVGIMAERIWTAFLAVDVKTYFWFAKTAVFIAAPLGVLVMQHRRRDAQSRPFSGELAEAATYATLIFLLLSLGNWGTRTFIYFQF